MEADSDLYRKYQETHFQKAYDLETMKKLIEQIMKFGIVGVLSFGIDFGIHTA